jgi:hypothetical protein
VSPATLNIRSEGPPSYRPHSPAGIRMEGFFGYHHRDRGYQFGYQTPRDRLTMVTKSILRMIGPCYHPILLSADFWSSRLITDL